LFYKNEGRKAEQILLNRLVSVGMRKLWREGLRGYIWCQYCVYMYLSRKMRPIETFPGMKGGEDKGEC
jgi:hypothetical protein